MFLKWTLYSLRSYCLLDVNFIIESNDKLCILSINLRRKESVIFLNTQKICIYESPKKKY